MTIRPLLFALSAAVLCMLQGCHAPIATEADVDIRAKGTPLATTDGAKCERLGKNRFHVSIPRVRSAAVKQPPHTQWCWAACTATVLNAKGQRTSPADVASMFSGVNPNAVASPLCVMLALNPDLDKRYRERLNKGGYTGSEQLGAMTATMGAEDTVTSDWLISQLSEGEPAVVGLHEAGATQGHLCVIYGATYSQAAANARLTNWVATQSISSSRGSPRVKYVLHSVDIVDPDPDVPMYSTLPASYVRDNVDLLLTRKLARDELQDMIRNGTARNRTFKKTTTYQWHLEGGTR